MSTDPYADANTFSFGDSPELAEELLALVLAGTKTATCGACAIFPKAAAPVRRSAGAMLCWTALADVRRSSKPLKSRSGVSMRSMKVSPTKKVKVPGRWQTGGKAIASILSVMGGFHTIWNLSASASGWLRPFCAGRTELTSMRLDAIDIRVTCHQVAADAILVRSDHYT